MLTSLSQKEIRLPERSAILLFALDRLGEVYTEIKLQKLIFQVQSKAKPQWLWILQALLWSIFKRTKYGYIHTRK